jgi:DNA-binding transcriptional LysR family regulator
MMDQLTEMRVFVRAIERGTFAAAAGDQGLTPSAVSKLIRRLEARLGVRLINRTTRKLSLTSEGETYFHSGRRLIEAVDGLEDEVAASAGHPRGLLRINTEIWWGVQHLAPALIDFQQRYPDVRVSLSLTDRLVDLHAEQIDVAIRLGPLNDSNLMSRKLAEVDRVICASPQYVERFGVPKTRLNGNPGQVKVSGTFSSDSLECILQLALQGAGIARLADYMVAGPIRAGTLVRLLADQHHPERTPAFAVFPPGMQKVPKVRAFLDFLIERSFGVPGRYRKR